MGLFDRIREALGSSGSGDVDPNQVEPGDLAPGIDRGSGTRRAGMADDDERKTGSHGSHWDTVVEGNEPIREAIITAIEEGNSVAGQERDGRSVEGFVHPARSAVRTCAVVVDATVVTGYPLADGVAHEMQVREVIEWANDVEAQLVVDVKGAQVGVFDAGYFQSGPYDPGETLELELAALAYDLGPAEAETITDDDGNEISTEGMVGAIPFDGGDLDDYVFQSTVEGVVEESFGGRTLYRLRLPLLEVDDEEIFVDVYASENVVGDYEPAVGDDVDGVVWLQAHVR